MGMKNADILMLKPSAMCVHGAGVGEYVSRKFAVRRKDYLECLSYVPNHVQCFITAGAW